MTHEKQREILDFWFGGDSLHELDRSDVWFGKATALDNQIRARFGERVESAGTGAFDDWAKTAQGALALILLLDQFPRNIYRGDAKSFAFDERARRIAENALDRGLDSKLSVIERIFLYLPFEHSEDLAAQDRAVELYTRLAADAEPDERAIVDQALEYASLHRAIISRFGRFPHRNDLIGRETSPEEREFLKTPNSSF